LDVSFRLSQYNAVSRIRLVTAIIWFLRQQSAIRLTETSGL
jgi:hypothetical protein